MKKLVLLMFCLISLNSMIMVQAQTLESKDKSHHWINYQQKQCDENDTTDNSVIHSIHIDNGSTEDAFLYHACSKNKTANSVPVDVLVSNNGQHVSLHILGREIELNQFQSTEIIFEDGQGTKSSFVFEYH
jgi:hypothetical protein